MTIERGTFEHEDAGGKERQAESEPVNVELLATVQGLDSLMQYHAEDFEQDTIQGLSRIEEESGLSFEQLREARKESGILGELAQLHAHAQGVVEQPRQRTADIIAQNVLGEEALAPFDPIEELKNIRKGTRAEQKQRLAEFKERFSEQRIVLAQVQNALVEAARENPALFSEKGKRSRFVEQIAKRCGLGADDKIGVWYVIDGYVQRNEAVEKAQREHANDQELFKYLFGRDAKGDVEIEKGPATFYVKCFNIEDYALIGSEKFLKDASQEQAIELSEHDLAKARLSTGRSLEFARQEELHGTILAENSSLISPEASRETQKHEEEHALHRLFELGGSFSRTEKKLLARAREAEHADEWAQEMTRFFRAWRESYWEPAEKTEILAYALADRLGSNEIYGQLTKPGGLYDYREFGKNYIRANFKNSLPSWHKEQGAGVINARAEKIVDTVLKKEYVARLNYALDAFDVLVQNGFSREETAAILMLEPLSRWEHTASRILRSQKGKERREAEPAL